MRGGGGGGEEGGPRPGASSLPTAAAVLRFLSSAPPAAARDPFRRRPGPTPPSALRKASARPARPDPSLGLFRQPSARLGWFRRRRRPGVRASSGRRAGRQRLSAGHGGLRGAELRAPASQAAAPGPARRLPAGPQAEGGERAAAPGREGAPCGRAAGAAPPASGGRRARGGEAAVAPGAPRTSPPPGPGCSWPWRLPSPPAPRLGELRPEIRLPPATRPCLDPNAEGTPGSPRPSPRRLPCPGPRGSPRARLPVGAGLPGAADLLQTGGGGSAG